ncbi:hypothetical protein ACQ0MK_20900 [Thalassospira lucentensis]|uniref:hypothetical protein n=1 Tax=Thalassospira lucentensis TaxID=168935 RepID=UPI003D2F3BB3
MNNEDRLHSREIHYRYAIAFLLAIMVGFVSLAYYDVPGLVDKLSFALTLSSLLLAVLAIFYTIISSSKQEKRLGEIVAASEALSDSVQDVKIISQKISALKNEIPTHFNKIDKKIDNINSNYLSRIEEKPSEIEIGKVHPEENAQDIESNIIRIQYGAMLCVYLFVKCFGAGRAIEKDDVENISLFDENYLMGSLTGFSSTKLIEFSVHNGAIIPKHCDVKLFESMQSLLEGIEEVIAENTAVYLRTGREKIDNYLIGNVGSQEVGEALPELPETD